MYHQQISKMIETLEEHVLSQLLPSFFKLSFVCVTQLWKDNVFHGYPLVDQQVTMVKLTIFKKIHVISTGQRGFQFAMPAEPLDLVMCTLSLRPSHDLWESSD